VKEFSAHTEGFSVLELMVVLAIISILVAMAVPLYVSTRAQADQKTCYSNQRILDGAAMTWVASAVSRSVTDLGGVVNASHPIVVNHIVGHAPACTAAPTPADLQDPTAAEGAYTYASDGTLEPCMFGALGAHGTY